MLRKKVDVTNFKEEVERLRSSRLVVILLVYFALVLDNMLLTVVVPIIPDYLYQMEHPPEQKAVKADILNSQAASLNAVNSGSLDEGPLANPDKMALPSQKPANDFTEKKYRLLKDQPKSDMGKPDFLKTRPADSRNYIDPGRETILQEEVHSLGRPPGKDKEFIVQTSPDRVVDPGRERTSTKGIKTSGSRMDLESLKDKTDNDKKNKDRMLSLLRDKKMMMSGGRFEEDQTIASTTSVRDLHRPSNKSTLRLDSVQPMNTDLPSNDSKVYSGAPMKPKVGAMKSEDPPSILLDMGSNSSYTDKLPQDIINENGRVGLLFSSKAFVQLIVNPFIGPLTSRVGYSLPLLVGTHHLILSALLFAYAESYSLLFVARSIQGIASSCIAISGMGIIAECYPEDRERGRMQGMVMGGIALGVLAGYPLGGLLYDFTNSKAPPFLLVAALTTLLALLQLAVLNPRPVPERLVVATPISGLIRDPYILVTAGAVMVSTSAMAVLEPCLPIWLTDNLHPQRWQLGTVFIPDSVGYLVGTSCTAGSSYRIGRWRAAVIAMIMVAFAAATVPEAGSMMALVGPHLFLGMGVGTVDAALMPLLAAIVDARHVAAYGAVYAIAQAAVALAYGFGPLVGGAVVRQIGFPWLMRGVAILNLCYCPLLFSLTTFTQDPTETQAILMAAPDPSEYHRHTTSSVQPHEASMMYQQLFDEED